MTLDLSVYDNVHCIQFQDFVNAVINQYLPVAADWVALLLHMPIIEVVPGVILRLGHLLLIALVFAIVEFYLMEVRNVD